MSGAIHSGVQEVNLSDFENGPKNVLLQEPKTQSTLPYGCDLCNIKATSLKLLQRHLEGKKHLSRIERFGKTFECDICQVTANSQHQLDLHLKSSKHKTRVARKERMEIMALSNSKGTWIILFGVICIFLNLLILFKMVL